MRRVSGVVDAPVLRFADESIAETVELAASRFCRLKEACDVGVGQDGEVQGGEGVECCDGVSGLLELTLFELMFPLRRYRMNVRVTIS